jgi:DNA uptake protein ComE-like DNA-binding protein
VAFTVTLTVTGASAETASTSKSQAQPGATNQAPAQPAASKPAASPATPAPAHDSTATKPPPSSDTKSAKAPTKPAKKVDLNNASLAELKTLPTVGDAEAKKIIANRPYKSKGELITKAGLPEGVYLAVRYKVELQKPRKPAPTK